MTRIELVDGRQVDVDLEPESVLLRVATAERVGGMFVQFGDATIEVAAIDHVEGIEGSS